MQLTISEEQSGMLLRQMLKQLRLSSKMIRHLKFLPDGILVNGAHVTVRYVLRAGDRLTLATEDEVSAPIKPVDLPIEILYEDEDLVVPSKPANMPTHPSCDHYEDTVANALAYRYSKSGISFVFRPINRLDRNTSGLLLIARNRIAASCLSEAMQRGAIQKRYLAVLDGVLPEDRGVIDRPLHRTAQSVILPLIFQQIRMETDQVKMIFAMKIWKIIRRDNCTQMNCAQILSGRFFLSSSQVLGRTSMRVF